MAAQTDTRQAAQDDRGRGTAPEPLLDTWQDGQRRWEADLARRSTPSLLDALSWRLDLVHRREDLRGDPSRPLWFQQAEVIGQELQRRGIRVEG